MTIGSGRIKVGVLRGGPSVAYDDSLKTGSYVLSLLRERPEEYEPLDIFISRDGEWHQGGLVVDPHKVARQTDVIWNALHGQYGEDGEVQKLLEALQIPFTGSGALAAALAHNKHIAKGLYSRHAFNTPAFHLIDHGNFHDDQLIEIFQTYMHPVIVKPAIGVRALGVRLAHSFHELKDAVSRTLEHSPKVLVEEYIRGSVSSCTVIERAKGEALYTLLPTGNHAPAVNREIEETARRVHTFLGQRHYSTSDFIVTPKQKIYILETNSLPVLHEDSLLNHSLKNTGWRPTDFADHCLKLALNRVEI